MSPSVGMTHVPHSRRLVMNLIKVHEYPERHGESQATDWLELRPGAQGLQLIAGLLARDGEMTWRLKNCRPRSMTTGANHLEGNRHWITEILSNINAIERGQPGLTWPYLLKYGADDDTY